MRVFVGEFICGGGFARLPIDQVPQSLQQEGAAMLGGIASDLVQVADVVVPLDPRLEIEVNDGQVVHNDPDKPPLPQWIEAARGCDAALIIAPENEGTLAKVVGVLRSAGLDVIAGSGDFLRVASDKLLTARTLHAAGVAHPPFLASSDNRLESELEGFDKYVMKPRDGCGTQSIRTFDSLPQARSEMTPGEILQPWIDGQPISITVVVHGATQTVLPAVEQFIDPQTCAYAGGRGPLDDDAQRRATSLAAAALAAVPGARGFVGLDLMLGEKPSQDCVIEINPRVTTSYVGLRKMINGNIAARLLGLESGPVACSQAAGSVRWTPAGEVWVDDNLVAETVVDHA
jgi:predicted ATP-grasp superfamily ATP-dependent carboligase